MWELSASNYVYCERSNQARCSGAIPIVTLPWKLSTVSEELNQEYFCWTDGVPQTLRAYSEIREKIGDAAFRTPVQAHYEGSQALWR